MEYYFLFLRKINILAFTCKTFMLIPSFMTWNNKGIPNHREVGQVVIIRYKDESMIVN